MGDFNAKELPMIDHRKLFNMKHLQQRRTGDSNPQPVSRHLISSQFPDLSNDQPPLELRDGETGEVPVLVPSSEDGVSSSQLPPELARVVAAWDQLPDAIRTGILALVEAAYKTPGGGRD